MTNDYYNATTTISRNSAARSAQENSDRAAVAAGFDKLPSESNLINNATTYVTDTGTADNYAATMNKAIGSYTEGLRIAVKIANTNTGACVISLDSLANKSIKRIDGTNPAAGDLTANDIVDMVYDGTNFVMLGPYRSHLAGIASNLGADLVFTGAPNFTGAPDFSSATNKAAIRSALGLAIGTNVQAHDAHLDDLSGLSAVGSAAKIMMSDAAGSWSYEDLVGTVSQSGGTPTGAVIEKGSNANGYYTRFADGTQICWNRIEETSLAVTTALGNVFTSGSLTAQTFPAAFSTTTGLVTHIFGHFAANIDGWVTSNGNPSTTALTVGVVRAVAAVSRTETFRWRWIAVGRWF